MSYALFVCIAIYIVHIHIHYITTLFIQSVNYVAIKMVIYIYNIGREKVNNNTIFQIVEKCQLMTLALGMASHEERPDATLLPLCFPIYHDTYVGYTQQPAHINIYLNIDKNS